MKRRIKNIYMGIKELGRGYSEYLKVVSDYELTVGNSEKNISIKMVDGLIQIIDNNNRKIEVNQLKPVLTIQDWVIDNI